MVFLFIVLVISYFIHDYDTSISMFFFNNYTEIVLFVIDMTFKALHDADPLDPSVLVLQDRHRSHLVDINEVCILLNIKYYYIL